MTEHYSKNTTWVSSWCKKCGTNRPHRVLDGRLAYCMSCFERSKAESEAAKKAAEAPPEQGDLW